MHSTFIASGITIHYSAKGAPVSNALRLTLNRMAGRVIFPVSQDISWVKTLTPPPAKPAPRRLTILTEPRARDEWTRQSSNQPVQFWVDSDDKDHCRKYSWRGRNNKYKDRRFRENGSDVTRAVDAVF